MCFSNLPIEFDDEGNPHLADEADGVERVADCGCGTDVAIDDSDPEAVFEAVLSSVPKSVREEISGRVGGDRSRPASGGTATGRRHGDQVEGD